MFGGNVRAPHTPTLAGAIVLIVIALVAYHFLVHKRR